MPACPSYPSVNKDKTHPNVEGNLVELGSYVPTFINNPHCLGCPTTLPKHNITQLMSCAQLPSHQDPIRSNNMSASRVFLLKSIVRPMSTAHQPSKVINTCTYIHFPLIMVASQTNKQSCRVHSYM